MIVVELDPVRALEAAYEGMRVTDDRAGRRPGRRRDHGHRPARRPAPRPVELLRDGAMLGNMGHFSTEIDIAGLERVATAAAGS